MTSDKLLKLIAVVLYRYGAVPAQDGPVFVREWSTLYSDLFEEECGKGYIRVRLKTRSFEADYDLGTPKMTELLRKFRSAGLDPNWLGHYFYFNSAHIGPQFQGELTRYFYKVKDKFTIPAGRLRRSDDRSNNPDTLTSDSD